MTRPEWLTKAANRMRPGGVVAALLFCLLNSGCTGTAGSGGTQPGGSALSVTITAPSSGATVKGTVNVTATAADSVAISKVQFQLDGSNLGAPVTSAPYSESWNTASAANGQHSLTAVATDVNGKTATSATVSVTVNNGGSTVTVSITAPASGATVSGTVTVSANASASAGVKGVQFLLDGADLGTQDTTSPYSVSWNTTTASDGAHVLAARATDQSGNTATSANVSVTVSQNTPPPPPPPPAGDDITISDASGSGQTNRPVSIARPFVQGEIADFAQASIGGTAIETQCDVKNRWPDGSLKFAVVSFVIPNIPANGSVVVSFANQSSGNNTGFLAQSDMTGSAYNFDGQIKLSGSASHNISARAILSAAGSCHDPGQDPDGGQFDCIYWLKGPVVTAVILEDRSGRSFDVNTDNGTGNPLHPIFEAWFYPQGNLVQLGYTLENSWASTTAANSARDQVYSVSLTGGNANPVTEYTNASFTHITRTRWHRTFCINGSGAGNANECGPLLHVDHNWPYLAETKSTPHWDTNLKIAPSKIAGEANAFAAANRTLGANSTGIGFYPSNNNGGGFDSTGAAEWHGPLTTWDIVYLISQCDAGNSTSPQCGNGSAGDMRSVTLGNGDLGNAIPYFYREADANAGHGQHFDAAGTVGTQGRVVSINARTQVSLLDAKAQSCGTNFAADWINFGGSGQDYGVWGGQNMDTSHWPNVAYTSYLTTGQYAYYEEQLMQSAYAEAASPGSRACVDATRFSLRQGSAGYWYTDQERGNNWMGREVALGAFIAVDGSPEQAYFTDKLQQNLAVYEGSHGVANDIPGNRSAAYTYGQNKAAGEGNCGAVWICTPTTLGSWSEGQTDYVQNVPLIQTGTGAPAAADANFQMAYSTVMIGWYDDLGYCPHTNGFCQLLGYVTNRYFNVVLNPAANMYNLADYVYPTLDATGKQITSWTENQTFYVSQLSAWPVCSAITMDESYGHESLAGMSYLYTLTSAQGGYSGSTAYNKVRSTIGCINNAPGHDFASSSPKWDITPRATNPPPAP